MKEVCENLFVGNEEDCQKVPSNNEFAIVHACKEPYHRQFVGYKERGAPKEHPEYLYALRNDRIALNIVDADNKDFFDKSMIGAALNFIDNWLHQGRKVLVHCNQGLSRSPSIAMLYMAVRELIPNKSIKEAEKEFIKLYPEYQPKTGIRGHIEQYWDEYMGGQ